MGAIAQTLTGSGSRFAWLWGLLRDEMAPYRGRVALVGTHGDCRNPGDDHHHDV
jgi:hypothetical protein